MSGSTTDHVDDGPVGDELDPVPAQLDEAPGWADPKWEGHSHSWPELANLDELPEEHVVSCSECGLPMLAGELRDQLRAVDGDG